MGTEWFALLIPIFLSLGALALFKHKLIILEVLLPIGIGIIVIGVMKYAMANSITSDTEYLSGYVKTATYFEPWDEYIHETCTRSYPCGEDTCTETYDCSYVRYHSAHWEVKLNNGKKVSISKSYWNKLVKLFGNKSFVDMHRDYHFNDGDAHVTKFMGEYAKLQIFDWSQSYTNKPQTKETIFHFEPLKEDELDGVVDYPENKNWIQNACIGCTQSENITLRKLNGLLGYNKEVHVFIVKTQGQRIELAERQKRHWKNGNKNELVIIADKDGEWAKSFSWADDKGVEAKTNYLFQRDDLTFEEKIIALDPLIKKHWVRKQFKDFDYIKVELSNKQTYWIYGIVFLVSMGCLIWGVMNDLTDDNNLRSYGKYTRRYS